MRSIARRFVTIAWLACGCGAERSSGVTDTAIAQLPPLPADALLVLKSTIFPGLAQSDLYINVGQSYSLDVIVEGGQFGGMLPEFVPTWSTSNSSVVSVSGDGDLVAKALGRAKVTASVGALSTSVNVVVNPAIARLSGSFGGGSPDSCSFEENGQTLVLLAGQYKFLTPDSVFTFWEWHLANVQKSYAIFARFARGSYTTENTTEGDVITISYPSGSETLRFNPSGTEFQLTSSAHVCSQTGRPPDGAFKHFDFPPPLSATVQVEPSDTTVAVGAVFTPRIRVVDATTGLPFGGPLIGTYGAPIHSTRPAVASGDLYASHVVAHSAGTATISIIGYGVRGTATVRVQ